ncbi:hypothetical protein ACNKHN_00175 [Shigella flexneri]
MQSSLDAIKDDFDVFIEFYPSGRYAEPSRFLLPAWQRDGVGTTGFDEAGKQANRDAAADLRLSCRRF